MEFFDPSNTKEESEVGSLLNDLGQKAELEGLIVEWREKLLNLPADVDPVEKCSIAFSWRS